MLARMLRVLKSLEVNARENAPIIKLDLIVKLGHLRVTFMSRFKKKNAIYEYHKLLNIKIKISFGLSLKKSKLLCLMNE